MSDVFEELRHNNKRLNQIMYEALHNSNVDLITKLRRQNQIMYNALDKIAGCNKALSTLDSMDAVCELAADTIKQCSYV